MVELAIENEQGMSASREEIDRGGVIYTVDTLANLHAKMPDCELIYLIGADTLRALGTWRQVDKDVERCRFLVMSAKERRRRMSFLWQVFGRSAARISLF